MIKGIIYTKGMSDKEIMYVVACEWVDEICLKAVESADELMANKIVRELIVQGAEQKLAYENKRKKKMLENDADDFWYNLNLNDWKAYKTVLYDTIFINFGINNHNT